MPRIENMGKNVDDWNKVTGEGSSTHDICRKCFKSLRHDPHVFDHLLEPYNGDPIGEDGWGGDHEHPPYEDCDYDCVVCEAPLTSKDD